MCCHATCQMAGMIQKAVRVIFVPLYERLLAMYGVLLCAFISLLHPVTRNPIMFTRVDNVWECQLNKIFHSVFAHKHKMINHILSRQPLKNIQRRSECATIKCEMVPNRTRTEMCRDVSKFWVHKNK